MAFPTNTETSKAKSIIIDGDIHKEYRDFCRGKGLKIGTLTEDLIKLYLSNPKIVQKLIDDLKEKV